MVWIVNYKVGAGEAGLGICSVILQSSASTWQWTYLHNQFKHFNDIEICRNKI